jgi:hypothetical protein
VVWDTGKDNAAESSHAFEAITASVPILGVFARVTVIPALPNQTLNRAPSTPSPYDQQIARQQLRKIFSSLCKPQSLRKTFHEVALRLLI